jgi:hypothetical protein
VRTGWLFVRRGRQSTTGRRALSCSVIPANFAGQLRGPGYWIPLAAQLMFMKNLDLMHEAHTPWLVLDGRLRPGFTRAAATRELNLLAAEQDRRVGNRTSTMSLTNGSVLQDPLLGRTAALIMLLLMSGLTLLLVIACANVTVLLLSRATARQQEMAMRVSLGASRGRLAAMVLTEGLLFAIMALPFSWYLTFQVPRVAKVLVPMLPYYNMRPNLVVFGYMVLLTSIAGCIAGLAPAAESLRHDVWSRTRGGRVRSVFGARWRMQDMLIVQVGMSLVLLIAAGLFVQAQSAIRDHDPGFDADHTIVVPIRPPLSTARVFIERVQAIPGVRTVAWAQASPLDVELLPTAAVRRAGQSTTEAGRTVAVAAVSGEYFDLLKLSVGAGTRFRGQRIRMTKSRAPSTS